MIEEMDKMAAAAPSSELAQRLYDKVSNICVSEYWITSSSPFLLLFVALPHPFFAVSGGVDALVHLCLGCLLVCLIVRVMYIFFYVYMHKSLWVLIVCFSFN